MFFDTSLFIDNYTLFLCFCTFLTVLIILYHTGNFRKKSVTEQHTKVRKSYDCDVVIVGSGVLGSALATTLARDGRKVVVVERDLKEPDRIVGELLQPGGCRALNELGLADCLENIDAQQVLGYVVHDHNKDNIDINFPTDLEDVKGARAFVHGKFVQALRKKAQNEKNVTYIEGTVTRMFENERSQVVEGIVYKLKNDDKNQIVTAKLVVVADGCFSRLRKDLVKEQPKQVSTFVALELRDCSQIKHEFAELVLTDPSPILIYKISSNIIRMLIDIRTKKLPKDLKSNLKDKIYHQLPDHLQDPFIQALEQGPIKSMPNNFLPPHPVTKKGALILGDALNMRHPITGGGMSVALWDVVMFRKLLINVEDLSDYDTVQKLSKKLYIERKNNYSFVVNVLSMALYELFAAENVYLCQLQKACFQYFKLGGDCVRGPIGLLSVLKPRPFLLIYHFFSVALYAIYFSFKSYSFRKIHTCLCNSLCICFKACSVLFPLIWSEIKTCFTF